MFIICYCPCHRNQVRTIHQRPDDESGQVKFQSKRRGFIIVRPGMLTKMKMNSSPPNPSSLHDSNEKSTTTTTAVLPSRLPLREINNVATTTSRRITQTQAKPRDQRHARSVDFPRPIHNTKRVSSRDRRPFPQHPQSLLQTIVPASTSHTRYSKPYSLSKFAPKSHLPHSHSKPSNPVPTSGPLRQKSSSSHSILEEFDVVFSNNKIKYISQHRSRHSAQSRNRAIQRALPNPKAAPPDSDIANFWSEVQAHTSVMSGPTATSQMVTDTQSSDNNGQLDYTLDSFGVEPALNINPQLSTLLSPDAASTISAELVVEIKAGAKASDYMVAVKFLFFKTPGMPAMNAPTPLIG